MAAENTIETAANLAVAAMGAPSVIKADDGREFLVVPDRMKSTEITPPNSPEVLMPKLVAQHVRLQTVESLVTYVNRFKNFDTAVFANINTNTLQAIIDYHKMPGANIAGDGYDSTAHNASATLAKHLATLQLPYSQEWVTWTRADDKLMSHRDFATFLEENQIDVISPVGGDLLEICRDLQVINNVNFSSSVRSGDYNKVSFAKESDATAKGDVLLPVSITLRIPVYFGENAVTITAWMRRKIDDGELLLGFKLSRAENVRQDEFHRIVGGVANEVECTTLYGTAS